MKIIGLDISSGYATAVFLEHRPEKPVEFVQSPEFIWFEVKPNHSDLEALIALDADFIVIEPTGYHYEKLICDWLRQREVEVRQATGWRVSNFRGDLGLRNKTDPIDALTLAIYGWDKCDDPKAFVPRCELEDLRQWWLQRQGLMRIANRYVQRLKQQLAHEFPECCNFDLDRSWGEEPHGLINWIAGKTTAPTTEAYYRNRHDGGRIRRGKKENGEMLRWWEDNPGTVGSKVSDYSKFLTRQLYDIQTEMLRLETQCNELLAEERFDRYHQAFDLLGISANVRAIWMTRIYPFDRFLVDNKPYIIRKRSRNGKIVTCDKSLGQFKAALGAGKRLDTSGTRQVRDEETTRKKWKGRHSDRPPEIPIGDPWSRRAFFMWNLAQVETAKPNVKDTELGKLLIEKRNTLKAKGHNIYQRSGNLHGYAARLLYRELLKRHRQSR